MSFNIAVIVGSFHGDTCQIMVNEVRSFCSANDVNIASEIWVPGSMEKPLALKLELAKPDIDGAILLGVIEKGSTLHGATMGQAVIQATLDLQLQFMKPVGVGIMGPGIELDQISSRTKPYALSAAKALLNRLQAMTPQQ